MIFISSVVLIISLSENHCLLVWRSTKENGEHTELPVDQPPVVAFTAFADVWPWATETEVGAALCAIGAGKDFDFDLTS